MPRGKANSPKAGTAPAFGVLGGQSESPVAVGDVDLPRPVMRVLQSDPPVAPVAPVDSRPVVEQAVAVAPTPSTKRDTLYHQLDALLVGHLSSGHADYAVLHPILVSLAAAKFKAHEALETVSEPATADLLRKIKAL
jgi:hypothetical protein